MVCTSCGTEVRAGDSYCANCGAALQADADAGPSGESGKARGPGLASGGLILIRSIFTMPIKTANLAAHELRKIAKTGAIDSDRDFPHLFWCKAMLPVVATFLSALVLLGTLGLAVAQAGIAGFFIGIFAATLAAITADWFIMIVGEYLMIKVVSARYYLQHIEEYEEENERH
ncbi:zinc ribbon domain-containing protein [Sphingorhabdus sp. SMR4y]|uniref:zinc ribbon domain-containing protein n=1 Tax=Sphingorhabdus sp. SMR4y TaxID=2584094 RepID=UPI000B5CD143|nr:zinc ribbon domain-containing protein [Sphingorhabdus sp. SMR4y]ASK89578.1 zinc-ribbon domain protein [Sphingorhabdus sp. SMR4y]